MGRLKSLKDAYKKNGMTGVRRLIGRKLLGPAPIDITEEYVLWLSYANAGMLERGNLYCFDHAIKHLPDDSPIIEIGSFCGLSTNIITYYKQKHEKKNKLITCDRWRFEGGGSGLLGESGISHEHYSAFVKDTFKRNVEMFSRSDLPYTIEAFSDEFFHAWRASAQTQDVFSRIITLGGQISFAFIDGNHSLEFAQRDFHNCDEFLSSGGFILFDDSADGTDWDVCKVVKQVAALGRYELIIKNPNYLFRKL